MTYGGPFGVPLSQVDRTATSLETTGIVIDEDVNRELNAGRQVDFQHILNGTNLFRGNNAEHAF